MLDVLPLDSGHKDSYLDGRLDCQQLKGCLHHPIHSQADELGEKCSDFASAAVAGLEGNGAAGFLRQENLADFHHLHCHAISADNSANASGMMRSHWSDFDVLDGFVVSGWMAAAVAEAVKDVAFEKDKMIH